MPQDWIKIVSEFPCVSLLITHYSMHNFLPAAVLIGTGFTAGAGTGFTAGAGAVGVGQNLRSSNALANNINIK